jgi:membrane protein
MTTPGKTSQPIIERSPEKATEKGADRPASAAPEPTGIRGYLALLWATIFKFFGDNCSSMAAALSFYTFFSLPALLGLLLALIGRVTDPVRMRDAIIAQVGGLIGRGAAEQVGTIVARSQQSTDVTLATVLSLLALAFGATTSFAQLQGALNKVWGVKPDPRRNQIRVFLVKRVFSFGVVVTVAFLLLVSLTISAVLAALGTRLAGEGLPALVLEIGNSIIALVVAAGLFAVMFRYLPDARISWHDVRAGAIGSAIMFVAGKAVIGLYLGSTDPGNAYGAAGSLAIVLIWVYYTSMTLLLGAEFTERWAQRFGRGVRPEKGAVAYVEEERQVKKG